MTADADPIVEHDVALVLAGGIALGAYQVGAYSALEAAGIAVGRVAGSSIGAINAALIAGNAAADRMPRLREFWGSHAAYPSSGFLPGQWQHLQSWMSAAEARLFGVRGQFRPSLNFAGGAFSSLYDLSPLKRQLVNLVDFERLNSGDIRVAIAATDIESGELMIFDTAKGVRLEPEHFLASCGFLPEFAPVEIGGRLLGDGGLSANAPLEAVLGDREDRRELLCFILDLYARDGRRPSNIETALARKSDLLFGNQTVQRLEAHRRERRLRSLLSEMAAHGHDLPGAPELEPWLHDAPRRESIFYLSYRAPLEEAGPEKAFDYSPSSVARRLEAGALDMQEALRLLSTAADRQSGSLIQMVRRKIQ